MGDVVHLRHDTPGARLDEIEAAVYDTVDHMCLRLGELLWEAREIDPGGFRDWVEERMPFGYDKARRLVAIYLAYRELPADVQAQLPRPWQAMFALRRWAGGRLNEAIAAGEIGPDTTVQQALTTAKKWSNDSYPDPVDLPVRYQRADLLAGRLMATSPDDLDADVYRALTRWVQRRTVQSRT
jgi:hypothetical protein